MESHKENGLHLSISVFKMWVFRVLAVVDCKAHQSLCIQTHDLPGQDHQVAMPQFSVKNLSEVLPPQAFETMKLYPVELCQSKPLRCYDVYMMRTFVLLQVSFMNCQ